MSEIYARDRAPKAVVWAIQTVDFLGTSVASVRLRVTCKSRTVEWTPITIVGSSAGSVTCRHVLAASGADLPVDGSYTARAWMYDSGGALIAESDEWVILPKVLPTVVPTCNL